MTKEIQKWADKAMFTAEPIKAEDGPRVFLISASPDPLGSIAAACKMYKGEVVKDLAQVTRAERFEYFEQVQKTKLQAPFEFVQFHFMLEGVTRAFTHQMVRQRTAVYAQESLRFAVKEDLPVGLPPSLADTDHYSDPEIMSNTETYGRLSEAQKNRIVWDTAVGQIEDAYDVLVNSGMPAEDARGLLPHNTLTRLHYSTNLRGLLDHAGNRLCTQAQFEWRQVFSQIVKAIREYDPYRHVIQVANNMGDEQAISLYEMLRADEQYQWEEIADILKPVCYQTGRCEFKANFDRACSIRERVDANERIARPSNEWDKPYSGMGANDPGIAAIFPVEWLADPSAARRG